VNLDEWVVMPNHVHGILVLQSESARASRWDAPTGARLVPGSLGAIVNHFKANCTKRIRSAGLLDFAWQRGYFDHIIRDATDLSRIRRYIRLNRIKWSLDQYHSAD
jgi:REP element-mobilizing transposase RayT